MAVDNLTADVSDGRGFFSGHIGDLSRFGFSMKDLPNKLDQKAKRLSIIVSGHGKNFKLLARPRWSDENGYRKDLGVELINAPYGWTEFVMDFEPKSDDVWGEVHM